MAEMTIQQAFELALQHHQAGRLAEAEHFYRLILGEQPQHAGALHHLGLIAHQMGRHEMAAELIRQALLLKPDWPEAHSNLGTILETSGRLDEAIASYRQALALKPDYPDARYNLGNALQAKGDLDEAITAYRQALLLKPNYSEAHYNLGNALQAKGLLDEAISAYRKVLALRPHYHDAHNNLGNALQAQGLWDEAISAYRQAIVLGHSPQAWNNLGNALQAKGQLDEAIAAWRHAIALKSDSSEACNNLGNALRVRGQLSEAIAALSHAIVLKPDSSEAYSNLGNALKDKGELDKAIAAFRQAIALKPDSSEAYSNLGNALKDKGRLDDATTAYRQALALKPSYSDAHSNLIFSLHYHPAFDAVAVAQECRRWNQQHAEPFKKFVQPHANGRGADRRLRIGYVSSDFRNHPVGRFILPLLAAHDHKTFEVFCYAQVPAPDQMTTKLQAHADTWRSIVGVSDEQAADMIRQDQIDILVDLALHTAGNRLLVFARKPAPVQVAYLGYAGRTGLDTIDYRLSDRYLDPNDDEDQYYTGKSFRLTGAYCCYQQSLAMPVSELPALSAGQITFGCLNNFNKVTPDTLETWVRLLQQVGNARLLLLSPEGSHRDRVRGLLQERGVAPERLELLARLSPEEYFQTYQRIDIALDPFPCTGGTTTCDALWMGVPVVSLKGKTAVGRAGLSILSNVGLPELVANAPEEYIEIAARLANDLPRLKELRAALRPRMQASPLMDAPKFAQSIEAAYRQMWRKWCASKQGGQA